MTGKTFTATLVRDDPACFIPLDFDPRPIFGKLRAPVKVTLNGYTYSSTIAAMGGVLCVPLRKSHRQAAGLDGTETLSITLEHDTEPRTVDIPPALARALTPPLRARWDALSYTRQQRYAEAVESARKDDTRDRRIARIVQDLEADQ